MGLFPKKEPEDEGVKPGEKGNPFSLMNRIRRWWAMQNGWVSFRTLDYDDERAEYRLVEELIRKEDLPLDAVHCTGEPHCYAMDKICMQYGEHDNEFSAMNACLYMSCNKISDGLAVKWSKGIPWKLIIAAVGICIVIIAVYLKFFYMG